MTIQQLQYVVALDTYRHFVRAAESCFVAQPTLTLQVKKLEQQIDLVIFDRSSQPLKPTPMGEIFITKARQILKDIEELKKMVNDDRNQLEGTFHIGIIPTLAPYLLPLFLPDFSKKYPQTRLKVTELQSEKIIEGIEKESLDIGIMATPIGESHLREIPVFYEPFLLYAHTDNHTLTTKNISISELDKNELWLLEQGHCFRNQMLNLCGMSEGFSTNRNILFEGGSIETLKKMIQQTYGYTLIPELSYQKESEATQVRRFTSPEPAREISLVVSTHFTKELLLANLRKAILQHLPIHFEKNTRFVRIDWR